MNERLNTVLLLVVIVLLVFLFVRLQDEVGRFQSSGTSSGAALDTKTGQLCYTVAVEGEVTSEIPLCKDLATQ